MSAASRGPREVLGARKEKEISYLESSGRNNGSLRPASLIRHTIGDSIRKYRVREYEGATQRGRRRGRGIGEFGHGLSITNPPVENSVLSISLLVSFSPAVRLPPTLLYRERMRYLYPSIYLSAGMSESTNQALMHAKCAEEKLIVIHVRRLSHAFSTRPCPANPLHPPRRLEK